LPPGPQAPGPASQPGAAAQHLEKRPAALFSHFWTLAFQAAAGSPIAEGQKNAAGAGRLMAEPRAPFVSLGVKINHLNRWLPFARLNDSQMRQLFA
jgi:hypothetical protein